MSYIISFYNIYLVIIFVDKLHFIFYVSQNIYSALKGVKSMYQNIHYFHDKIYITNQKNHDWIIL